MNKEIHARWLIRHPFTSCLGDYVHDKNCTYRYKDGTKARFIKTKGYYEFKKAKSVIARVRLA